MKSNPQSSFAPQNIKNIVFDFGGVLLDIDYNRTYKALTSLLNTEFDPKQLSKVDIQAFHDFEMGIIDTATFIMHIQRLSVDKIPQVQEIIVAWNAMLIGWDIQKFDLLLRLRKKYKVFLLSNTNELHLDWVKNHLMIHHGIADFEQRFFDKTYYSHLVGMRKPNVDIYEYVLDDANIQASETIFIDDLPENIDGAHKVGYHTYLHNPLDNLSEIITHRLQLI